MMNIGLIHCIEGGVAVFHGFRPLSLYVSEELVSKKGILTGTTDDRI
jgi:hypothetical protein